MATTTLAYRRPLFAIAGRAATSPVRIAPETVHPAAQGRAPALDRASPRATRPRRDRVRAERSIDAAMILFVCFVGLPMILALSVAGGVLTVLLGGN